MSAGGGDENRSSYTARCAVITEADKMDTAGETSREAIPSHKSKNRTDSYPRNSDAATWNARCRFPRDGIWTEYQSGTASRIACQCPHCDDWVTPEREHLLGWQAADSEIAARETAHFACPSCGDPLSEADRVKMNRGAKLLHRGQSIGMNGEILGEAPQTFTLGFRWNAFNNLFWSAAEIAAKEWKAKHATHGEESLEKELSQFYWVAPYQSPDFDATPLDANQIRRRFGDRRHTEGIVPDDTKPLGLAIDLGKRFCTWTLMANRPGCRRHIVDYGTFEVPSKNMDVKRALLIALRGFRDDVILEGWHTPESRVVLPDIVVIDAGNWATWSTSFAATRNRGPCSGRRSVTG